jgi:hypothetical protein
MSKYRPQNFNDFLALVLMGIIPLMWVLQGVKIITAFPAEVNGVLMATWTLIAQYYFRKSPPTAGPTGGTA